MWLTPLSNSVENSEHLYAISLKEVVCRSVHNLFLFLICSKGLFVLVKEEDKRR